MRHRTAWSRWRADLRVAPARMAARRQARRGIQRADARSASVRRRMRTNRAKAGGPSALLTVLLVSAVLVVSLNVLVGGYLEHWAWTGYLQPPESRPLQDQPRTLWDWLGVSVLPLSVALTPLWLRTRGRRRRAWSVAAVLIASVLAVCALGGYLWKWTWTGFTGNTLYDWLQLLLVPCVLPVTFLVLDSKQRQAAVDQHELSTHHASSRAHVARGGAAAWAIGAALLLVVATVAALLEGGFSRTGTSRSIERPDQAPSSPAKPASANGQRWLIVDSQDPWWTDTGIHVTVGENVSISAVGRVRASPRHGYSWASPTGLPLGSAPRGYSSINEKFEHAALVGIVGHPGQVGRLEHASSSAIFDVGKNKLVPITRNGELFLGLNDRKPDDNRGLFVATITLPHDR
jgi:hypothetical protein